MKIKHVFILICVIHGSVFGQASNNHGFDLEKLEKVFQEQKQKSLNDIEGREGVDGPWLLQLYLDYRDGRQITNEELRHVWEIYEKEKSHRIEDKLYAFGLIAEFEDISKWEKEFDSLALSKDPIFVKTAIQKLFAKLAQGTEREKIILSNKTAVLEHLVQFAEDNKSDTTINRETLKLLEITKPYQGKTPPAESQRPDRRPSESRAVETPIPNEKIPDSSTVGLLVQKIGKGESLTIAGIIGIIIAAILIWRWKSKSAP